LKQYAQFFYLAQKLFILFADNSATFRNTLFFIHPMPWGPCPFWAQTNHIQEDISYFTLKSYHELKGEQE